MRTSLIKLLTLILTSAALISTAHAAAGDGLKAGRLVVSPSLTLSGSFDTNVFYESAEEADELSTAPLLNFTPALSLSTLDPDFWAFDANAGVTWQQYLSDNQFVSNQSGLAANVGAQLSGNRKGAFSFTLKESFERSNEPPTLPQDEAFNRNINSAGITLGLHPGGQVFQHYLSYNLVRYFHDELPEINRTIHDFSLKNYWRFLPRTAAVLSADYSINQYDESNEVTGFGTQDFTPLRLTGGLTGLITNRISARITGGWGWSFHDTGSSFSGLVLDLQAKWAFGNLDSKNELFVGYEQQFTDSALSNFVRFLRPYAGLGFGIARNRLRLELQADARFRTYETTPQATTGFTYPDELNDTLVAASAKLQFNILKWWSASAAYSLTTNITDDRIQNNLFPGQDAVREYTKQVVTFGTTVRY